MNAGDYEHHDGNRTPDDGSVWHGVLLALVAHAVGLPLIGFVLFPEPMFPVMLFGGFQFVYMVPLGLWLLAKRRYAMLKGVAIIAGISLLINATCYGLVMASFRLH